MGDPKDLIREILRKAYQIEVDGYTFYAMAAEKAEKPAVGELFEKLARDEVQHKAFLKTIAGRFEEQGAQAFHLDLKRPDLKAFTDTIFTERFREQARGAAFEAGVLSIGMTLEQNAISYFTGAAEKTTEAEVRDFYRFLADWERQHFEALSALYSAVRQDFWAESGFAPF
ncbi:MAG: ferritin-like domain-containing protein [Acidobacteriota bacterium]